MSKQLDVRGLSCPEPVLRTLETIKKIKTGELEILVDTDTAKENVLRAVGYEKWNVIDVIENEGYYKIQIIK